MLKLRDGVAFAELEYGMALLDEKSGDYWSLNPTGATVLRALLEGKTVVTAVDEIVSEYNADPDTVRQDVTELLTELRSARLIEEGIS